MKTIDLSIPDMQSVHCQMRVRNAIQTVPGVTVDELEPGKAVLTLEDENRHEELILAITKAGYPVNPAAVSAEGELNSTLRFKTNINCGGCVAKVSPFLDGAEGLCHWSVDTQNPDKILSVHSEGIDAEEVMRKVQAAGFKIQSLNH